MRTTDREYVYPTVSLWMPKIKRRLTKNSKWYQIIEEKFNEKDNEMVQLTGLKQRMVMSLLSLKVAVFVICLCFKMVSFRGQKKVGPRPDWFLMSIPTPFIWESLPPRVQIMLLLVYTTTSKKFVIFTRRYFKLSWNITGLSQSNCRNFSCSSISTGNSMICSDIWHKYREWYFKIVIRNCHVRMLCVTRDTHAH